MVLGHPGHPPDDAVFDKQVQKNIACYLNDCMEEVKAIPFEKLPLHINESDWMKLLLIKSRLKEGR